MQHLTQGEFTATLNGLKLWYKVSGIGPVCLFPTPGWGPSSDLYFRTLSPLGRIFTVVYLDTRGSGRSEAPSSPTEYRYDQFSADLDALRDHLQVNRIWVMGHSMGGWLAMHFALAYPERCCGLVLLDSIVAHDSAWRSDAKARRERRKNEPWYEEVNLALADPRIRQDDGAFCGALKSSLRFGFHDVANFAKLEVADGLFSMAAFRGMAASNPEGAPLLPLDRIKVPTLIVAGASDDRASPVQAQRIHLGISGSKLIVIENAGHFPWLEQPGSFFSLLLQGLGVFGLAPVEAAPVES